MEDKTRRKIEAVLAEAEQLVADGTDEFEAAYQAMTAQTTDVLKALAAAQIVDVVRRRQRSATLEVERQTTRTRSQFVHTEEYLDAMAEIDSRMSDSIGTLLTRYATEMKMQWTAELLDSDFAMADGTRVTWGAATVAQHEERAAMFAKNVAANAEGAARHLRAVEDLRTANRETLNEMVGVAA